MKTAVATLAIKNQALPGMKTDVVTMAIKN